MRRVAKIPWIVAAGMFLFCQIPVMNPGLLAAEKPAPVGERMPLTTKSAKVRRLLESAIEKKGNYRINESLADLRSAVMEDKKFAVAWALLGHFTDNPAEATQSFANARSLAPRASAPEQLLVGWYSNIFSNDMIAAIGNANDLLAKFPHDKYVLFLGADWFADQGSLSRSIDFFERIIQIDPRFTAAYNRLGYAYAFQENYPKALEVMRRYVALLPGDPNPQDSLADISMKAGKLEDAKAYFQAALALDPRFAASLHGLGDTYMLLGDYAHAREQDAKAVDSAANIRRIIWYRSSIAQTWVREKNLAKAGQEFASTLEFAHANGLHNDEANVLVQMSLYQPEAKTALALLAKAEKTLKHAEQLSAIEADEALSGILRWRAVRAIEAGDASLAKESIQNLQAKSDATGNDVVSANFHAAMGAWLVSGGKYSEAVEHLEEDRRNPSSLRLLVRAYRESGNKKSAEATETRLLNIYEPTMEQALVVVPQRESSARIAAK